MKNIQKLEQKAEYMADILKIMAHPKRLIILCKLANGPKHVNELESSCGLSQSQLSQFLGKMREEWILSSEKQWQFVTYSITDDRIIQLLSQMQKLYCENE